MKTQLYNVYLRGEKHDIMPIILKCSELNWNNKSRRWLECQSDDMNLDSVVTAEDDQAVKGAVCPLRRRHCPESLLEVLLRQQLSAQMLTLNLL